MARSLTELHAELETVEGLNACYVQAPTVMQYPCILIEQDDNDVTYADNVKYLVKNAYTIIVIDRDVHSLIPDLILRLPYTRRTRNYRTNGLYHFVIQIYY